MPTRRRLVAHPVDAARLRRSTCCPATLAIPSSDAATWRSGYAAACKAVYTGSIPVVASPTKASQAAGLSLAAIHHRDSPVSQRCRRTAAVTATVRASGDPAWRMGAVSAAVPPPAAAAAAVAAWVSAWNSRQAVARAHRPLVYRLPAVGAPPRGGCVGRRRAVGGPGGPAALWRTCDRRPRQRATGARRHDGGARQTNRPLVHLAARHDPVFGVDHPACLGKPPSARTSAASRSDSASASTAPTRASQLRATPPTG